MTKRRDRRVSFTPSLQLDEGIKELIASVWDKSESVMSRSEALAWFAERGLKSWKRKVATNGAGLTVAKMEELPAGFADPWDKLRGINEFSRKEK